MMVGVAWGPQKGPKGAPKSRKYKFFIHYAPKNAWILTKFEMELPMLCNYLHANFCGL